MNGAILRGGVAISAVLMVTGLVLTAIGSTHAGLVLNAGLVLLMMIPTARIIVSFVDATFRTLPQRQSRAITGCTGARLDADSRRIDVRQ